MPQRPFQPLTLGANGFTERRLAVHQTSGIVVQHGQLHREVKPIHNRRGVRAHVSLEVTDRVAAVR